MLNLFSERLDASLKQKGWNQADLHRTLGFAQSTVSRWKKGSDPRGATLTVLADKLGVAPEWLLGLTDNPARGGEPQEAKLAEAPPRPPVTVRRPEQPFEGVPPNQLMVYLLNRLSNPALDLSEGTIDRRLLIAAADTLLKVTDADLHTEVMQIQQNEDDL